MTDNNILKVDSVDGRPAVIVYECLSGVLFHITPLSLPTVKAIQLKSQDVYSYPDKAPYQVPDPVDVAFAPGQVSAAEDNPEYVAICKKIDSERVKWTGKAIFKYAAKMPKYPTKESLLEAYGERLAQLKEIALLESDADDDDYDLIVLNFVLTGHDDYAKIFQLAVQQLALTPEEISNGIRFFRARIQR